MLAALRQRKDAWKRISAQRLRLGFVNGIDWLIRDPSETVIGRTPYETILSRGKLVVRRYRGAEGSLHRTPVLLVPPLMVKPFIFDLHEGRSLVRHLLDAGYPVYLVDFGEPERADAYVTLDDYVLDWLPAACDAVCADAGTSSISLLGYCMGGLFALSHTAANEDERVRNIVAIAAPVDTHKMGAFAWIAKHGGAQVEAMAGLLGNVPGAVSSRAFKLLAPVRNVTRYADLFLNLYDQEYVNGFDAMNAWTSQFIDYPAGAFQQFLREFMRHNRLYEGNLRFGERVADLARVRASLLLFAGETDKVVPEAAVRGALEKVGSEDKTLHVVPGGHMGVFAGSRAPERVWRVTSDWLATRSGG